MLNTRKYKVNFSVYVYLFNLKLCFIDIYLANSDNFSKVRKGYASFHKVNVLITGFKYPFQMVFQAVFLV